MANSVLITLIICITILIMGALNTIDKIVENKKNKEEHE